jgi:hypothetical protein
MRTSHMRACARRGATASSRSRCPSAVAAARLIADRPAAPARASSAPATPRAVPSGGFDRRWPKKAAAIWLSCSTRALRASNSAMASGAVSIMRCSEACACAMLISAWRRRSMSSSAKVSCGAAGPRPVTHGVADDPELAPVAAAQPALEGLGLALRPGAAASGSRRSGWSARAWPRCDRLADEVGQLAAEHAARRAVHPLDAAVRPP